MNSSGIKRGLAGTAVAALAVTGLPFLANSASALDEGMSLLTAGPTRNGGDLGGLMVINLTGVTTATDVDANGPGTPGLGATKLALKAADLTSAAPAGAAINTTASAYIPGSTAGTGTLLLYVTAATPSDGTAVNYAVYLDNGATAGTVEGREARVQVTTTTTGVPTSVELTPTSQTAPQNVLSDAYTGTLKDSAGRTTQLSGTETLDIGQAGNTTISVRDEPSNPASPAFGTAPPVGTTPATGVTNLAKSKVPLGTFGFKASDPDNGTATIPVGVTGATVPAKSVSLVVTPAVTGLTNADVDIVTGADDWNGFGDNTFAGPTSVRVDQQSIKVDISDANDASTPKVNGNATISITATGSGGVTFGGKTTTTQTITLDAAAKGSFTLTPDAGSITDAGSISIASAGFTGGPIVLNYDTATAATPTSDSAVYVTKVGSPTTVVVTVKDQFGNPVAAPAQVSITRSGRAANAGTTARQTVGADGTATFTLADAGTTAGNESLTFNLFDNATDGTPVTSGAATITYTADGLGGDITTADLTANAADNVVAPITDALPDDGVDAVELNLTGGTNGATAKVTVDNGAVVIKNPAGSTNEDLANGAASQTIALDGAGTGSVWVAGTKAGVVTVTVESAGRTKTYKLTVKQAAAGSNALLATARNVELEGPEKATAGQPATFTATVTDAFGNPIAGLPVANLGFQITGPANFQSSDATTDNDGKLRYNVILTDNASSSVSVQVTGINSGAVTQFGKVANSQLASTGTATDAPGLSASTSTDSVTITDVVNIRDLEEAVEEAQRDVDAAQDILDAANDNLAVAKAEKKVAQKNVKAAKKDLKQAKKKKKGVKAAKAALRNAQGDLTVANAKANAAKNRVASAEERLADAQAELEAAEQALEDAQSDEG